MSVIWSGITEEGAVVPVQVTAEGKVVATGSPTGDYVKKTGDTMTGALQLPGDPVDALDACPKQYVDSRSSGNCFAFGYVGLDLDPTAYCFNVSSIRRTDVGTWLIYFETVSPTSKPTIVVTSTIPGVQTRWYSESNLAFGVQSSTIVTGALYDAASFSFSVFASANVRKVAYTD